MDKKYFAKIISLLLVICCVFSGCAEIFLAPTHNKMKELSYTAFNCESGITDLNYQSSTDMISDMQLICNKGDFEFYFDPSSLFFAVKSVSTGKIFTSNPYNASSSATNTSALHSQLSLNYGNNIDKVTSTLWSYDDCVKLNQFKVFKNESGVKVAYSIGKDAAASILPEILSEKTFNNILESLSGLAATQTKFLYTEYKNGSELPEKFKNISVDGSVYIINQNLSVSEKERLENNFEQAEFSLDDLKYEYAKLNYSASFTSTPNFKINVYYTLTEKGLSVTIPADEIQAFPIIICIYRFFCNFVHEYRLAELMIRCLYAILNIQKRIAFCGISIIIGSVTI